ncbi:MAG: SUMF1/EgtB/PvdO family nonheme iron enzyme [Phycisphaerales bacterium]|nr:SUMF1/EgtB/PvdO family nonheme iron enzyme [Phycisphaerales bacterium]
MTPRYTPLAGAACLLAAGAAASAQTAAAAVGATANPVEVVEVPKTTLSIELVTVDLGDGKQIQVARSEIDWRLYDTFVFSLDQEDPANPDDSAIVTRPTKPYINMDRGWGHDNYPAMGMSHLAAGEFCIWLSNKTGKKFRLPTEAEWEAIATQSGTTPDKVDARCWHAGNAAETTHQSATKEPDDLGLYDLLGNVGEWCFTDAGKPIARGGSYMDDPDLLTPQTAQKPHRSWNETDPQIPKSKWWLADCTWVGIRPVCEIAEPDEE